MLYVRTSTTSTKDRLHIQSMLEVPSHVSDAVVNRVAFQLRPRLLPPIGTAVG
jgi:hypothetical protein